MITVLDGIGEFWVSYGQWIGLALIPTVITGLTISAKTAKAAPVVQKIWDGIKIFMDFLSVVTHKDKMGTFKLPMQTSAKKDEKVKEELQVEVVKTDGSTPSETTETKKETV